MLRDGLTNFLFVGRIVPNKRIEDIIRLAEQFKRYIEGRGHEIGGWRGEIRGGLVQPGASGACEVVW